MYFWGVLLIEQMKSEMERKRGNDMQRWAANAIKTGATAVRTPSSVRETPALPTELNKGPGMVFLICHD